MTGHNNIDISNGQFKKQCMWKHATRHRGRGIRIYHLRIWSHLTCLQYGRQSQDGRQMSWK